MITRTHSNAWRPRQSAAGNWRGESELYARPEGEGLLISPCDQTPAASTPTGVDQSAVDLLAEKPATYAPGLADLELRRGWACLRTFAPDRRPVIGPDPDLPGLFHVSGLGGFGMTASAAIGELAAALIGGLTVDWLDATSVSVERPAMRFVHSRSAAVGRDLV